MKKRIYTVKQVAQALGFSTNTVYKYLDEGKIHAKRFGAEGRFRIPESEVIRLLGLKETDQGLVSNTPASQPVNSSPTDSFISDEARIEISTQLHKVSILHLFDWYVAVLGIFVGLSQLIFPRYTLEPSVANYSLVIWYVKISLIPLGFFFISLNIFTAKRTVLHSLLHILYSLVLGTLTFVFWQTDYYVGVIGYAPVVIILLVSIFIRMTDLRKFLIHLYLVAYLTGIVLAFWPENFGFTLLSPWLHKYNGPIALSWYLVITVALIVSMMSARKQKVSKVSVLILACLSLAVAFFSFTSSLWDQSVYASVLGSFILFIPWWYKSEFAADITRKNFIKSFITLVLMITLGTGLGFYIQATFKESVKKQLQEDVQKAAKTVEEYIKNSQDTIRRYQDNADLRELLAAKKIDTAVLQEKTKELYLVSRTFRRIGVLDSAGLILANYPFNEAVHRFNVSEREYFKATKASRAVYVSEIAKSKSDRLKDFSPTLVIAGRISGPKNEFLGAVNGGLNLDELEDQLKRSQSDTSVNFSIVDSKKNFALLPDKTLLATRVPKSSIEEWAAEGKQGVIDTYNPLGMRVLRAYTPINTLGWGVVEEKALENLLRENVTTAFSIFLIAIFSSIGSYLVTLYLQRNTHESK